MDIFCQKIDQLFRGDISLNVKGTRVRFSFSLWYEIPVS